MKKISNETVLTRMISVTFIIGALAIFKPFGLDTWQWYAYLHLLAMWVIGILSCMVTEVIVKYGLKQPRSYEQGVNYIIRRNLWFQLINTPLVSLGLCLYRHFVMSGHGASNLFSLRNYLETLAIIAFCSFAIGLYWRFKFRSRFLATELEETKMLNELLQKRNEQLQKSNEPEGNRGGEGSRESEGSGAVSTVPILTLTGTTNESVSLELSNLLYIEAVGNYVKVCYLQEGKVRTDMLRATSKQMEEDLRTYPTIVRSHRAFLVNLQQVEQIQSHGGTMQLCIRYCHESIPVSRSNMSQVKEAIRKSE